MADATLMVVDNRAVLQPFGSELLTPYIAAAVAAKDDATTQADRATLEAYLASQLFADTTALNAYTNANLALNDSVIIPGDGRYMVTSLSPLTWTRQGDSDGKVAATSASTASTAVANIVKALVLDIDPALGLPNNGTYAITAGRWRRDAGGWAMNTSANQERAYITADGVMQGVLMEGAETYYSAPFHNVVPTSGLPGWLTTTGTATITYAGAHATADRFGTTGGGVLITGGATASILHSLPNLGQACVTGDIVRIECIFHIVGTPGATGRFYPIFPLNQSGAIPSGQIYADFATDGTCTFGISGTPRRWDAQLIETIGGRAVYFVYWEGKFTASGTVAPQLRDPSTATANWKVMLHEMRIIKNPQTVRPSAVPVLAAAKTFAADAIQLPTTRSLFYRMLRLRRGRSASAAGKIEAVPGYRSGSETDPFFPYERRIEVKAATEVTSHDFIRPAPNQKLDFQPIMQGDDVTVYLDACYFNVYIDQASSTNTTGTLTIAGVEPGSANLPHIDRLFTTHTRLTNLTTRDVVVFPRASTTAAQVGQTNIAAINSLRYSGAASFTRTAFASHTLAHTRGAASRFEGETAGAKEVRYIGYNAFSGVNVAGTTLAFNDCLFYRMGRAVHIDNIGTANSLTLTANGVRFHEMYSDAWYFAQGIINATIVDSVAWKFTANDYDFYQSRDEVEVDFGSGRVALSASGKTVADLPQNRSFYLYSHRPAPGTAIADTDADKLLWSVPTRKAPVVSFVQEGTSAFNKTGYQFNAQQMPSRRGYNTYLGIPGSIYTSWALLLAETDVGDGDLVRVSAADAGTHADPYTLATVNNYGVYRYLLGYGWCRIADAWPASSGITYATKADMLAAVASDGNTRMVATGDPDAGVWEYQTARGGWIKIATDLTLPVYASTPGTPSLANPHIWVTADPIRWSTTSVNATLASGVPTFTSAGTHSDYLQLNATLVALTLLTYNSVLWGNAQGPFLQMFTNASRSTIASAELYHNITLNQLPNAFTVASLQAGGVVNIHDNASFFASSPFRYTNLTEQKAQYLITGAEPITTSNNWLQNVEGANFVSGNPAALSEQPKRIRQVATANGPFRTLPRRGLAEPVVSDMVTPASLDAFGMLDMDKDPREIVFTGLAEKMTGIPLNSIIATACSGWRWSAVADAIMEKIASHQRDPDYVVALSASTAIGTTVLSGLKGMLFDRDYGGAEGGYFTLSAGTIVTNKALTGLNVRWLLITDAGELIDIDIS